MHSKETVVLIIQQLVKQPLFCQSYICNMNLSEPIEMYKSAEQFISFLLTYIQWPQLEFRYYVLWLSWESKSAMLLNLSYIVTAWYQAERLVSLAQWFLTWVQSNPRGSVVWGFIGEYEKEKKHFVLPTTKGSMNACMELVGFSVSSKVKNHCSSALSVKVGFLLVYECQVNKRRRCTFDPNYWEKQ